MELLVVLTLFGLVASFAGPRLWQIRTQAALQGARAQVTAALALARSTSSRYGRTSILELDTERGVLTVRVDTGSAGVPAMLLVRDYRLSGDLGVQLRSDHDALCFDARGVGVTTASCPTVGALVRIRSGTSVDTVRINSAGRVW